MITVESEMQKIQKMPIEDIARIVTACSLKYYNTGNSPISNRIFDEYEKVLKEKNSTHSYFSSNRRYRNDNQTSKTLSCTFNSYLRINESSLSEIFQNHKSNHIYYPKIAGIPVILHYVNGIFRQAWTDSDKNRNEYSIDITPAIQKSANLPKSLSKPIECYIKADAFFLLSDYYNSPLSKINLSPRNTLQHLINGGSELCEYIYLCGYDIDGKFPIYTEILDYLELLQFPTFAYETDSTNVNDIYQTLLAEKNNFNYEIDGLVFVLDNDPNKIYITSIYQAASTAPFDDVRWEVGIHGEYIPYASLILPRGKKINLCNVSEYIPYASLILPRGKKINLCNVSEYTRLNPHKNEIITITPDDNGNIFVLDNLTVPLNNKELVEYPKNCPSCGKQTVSDEKLYIEYNYHLFCKNHSNCIGAKEARFKNWIRLNNIELTEEDIKNFGFASSKYDIKSLYDGSMKIPLTHPNFTTIKRQIEKSKSISIADFMGRLSIYCLGEKEARAIFNHYSIICSDINEWFLLNEIKEIKEIGLTRSIRIMDDLKDRENEIKSLAKYFTFLKAIPVGNPVSAPPFVVTSGDLKGRGFCFTGKLSQPRANLETLVKTHNGHVHSSVSKHLDYLVTDNLSSFSTKMNTAKRLGINIITEQEFQDLLINGV